ncbi:MAG TPA: hypothetical protein VJA17_01740 [Candidatus Omnitrophota bacterium]|nr:hypothetical protein [Candidatus Omnitrophota bacterium]
MIQKTKQLNNLRQSLFWDVDPKTIDLKKHARYIIERVVDFGNDREVQWMWEKYPLALIHKVVKTSRSLNPVSRPLWERLTRKR